MKVALVPIRTYQVKAIGVPKRTYNIRMRPTDIAHMAAFSPTRRVNRPSRKTPSSEP
jgi:hypothetical protein